MHSSVTYFLEKKRGDVIKENSFWPCGEVDYSKGGFRVENVIFSIWYGDVKQRDAIIRSLGRNFSDISYYSGRSIRPEWRSFRQKMLWVYRSIAVEFEIESLAYPKFLKQELPPPEVFFYKKQAKMPTDPKSTYKNAIPVVLYVFLIRSTTMATYALNHFSPDDLCQSAACFRLHRLQEHEGPPPNIPYLLRHGYCFFVKRSADA
jgi:hypothetical protein